MAKHKSQYRLREVSGKADHRVRGFHAGSLPRRYSGLLLPLLVASLGLPLSHVLAHRAPLLLHNLRLRCHQQRRGRSRVL